jgi:hypothetical protein
METRVNVVTTVRAGWFLEAKKAVKTKTLEGMTLSELLFHALMGDGRAETVGV